MNLKKYYQALRYDHNNTIQYYNKKWSTDGELQKKYDTFIENIKKYNMPFVQDSYFRFILKQDLSSKHVMDIKNLDMSQIKGDLRTLGYNKLALSFYRDNTQFNYGKETDWRGKKYNIDYKQIRQGFTKYLRQYLKKPFHNE